MHSTVTRLLAAVIGLGALALPPASGQEHQKQKAGAIKIEMPWLRATPTGAKVAVGYLKLYNAGKEADRLIGGSSPAAGAFEVHEMKVEGGVMAMRQLTNGLELPPGKSIELKPRSFHIMLIDLKRPLKEGDKIKGTLQFEKAGKVEMEYTVRGMGGKGGTGHGSPGTHGGRGGMKH